MRHRSLLLAALGTALLATALATFASAEIDALSLLPQPADEPRDTAPYKIVVEAAAGQAERRYGLGSRTIGRAALDLQSAGSLVNGLRGVFSARLDATDPQDSRISGVVLSLREAYMTWQGDTGATVVEFGRINLRSGPGYGFNPTDFFRDNALRTITTANPFSLRENRLGTVMLRGQHIWDGAALSLALAPEISARRSDAGLSADWGATNGRGRALLSLSSRIRDIASGQLLLF